MSGKSIKLRHRRINILWAFKALTAAAMVSLPVAVSTVQTATAYTWHTSLLNARNNEGYNNFRNVRLTNGSLRDNLCFVYNLALIAAGDSCDILLNRPDFWAPQPVYYRLRGCDPNDAGRFVENLYLSFTDPNAGQAGLAADQATGDWYAPDSPPPSFVDINFCQPDQLFNPSAANAQGFGGAATDDNAVFIMPISSRISNPASEDTNYGSMQVFRTGDMSQPITFNVAVGGTAVAGLDYDWRDQTDPSRPPANTNIGQVRFYSLSEAMANGQGPNFKNFFFYAKPQTIDRPERLITVTVNQLPPGYKLGGSSSATWVLEQVSIAKISLTNAGSSTALSYGSNPGFTITRRDGDLSQPLTVAYSVAGSASNGTDYNYLDGSITFAANQTTATIPLSVAIPLGSQPLPVKDLQISINPDTANDTVYQSQSPTLSYTIPAYDPASISVTVPEGGSAPRGETSSFTINRNPNGDLSQPLTVNYDLGGTATPGTDYRTTTPGRTGSVTIPAGQSAAQVPITVPSESGPQAQPAKDVTLTITPGQGYGLPDPAPSGVLTIPAYSPSAVQLGNSTDGFTFTRPAADTSRPLTLNYELGGTATPGSDYRVPGGRTGSVTIPAGETTATLPVDVLPNSGSATEPEETIVLSLRPGSGYDAAASQSSTITIPAYSPLTSGTSSNPPSFTVSRSGNSDLSQPVQIPYQVASGSTGQAGRDFRMPPSGTITIPAGQTVGALPVEVLPTAQPGRQVGITLTPPPGFGITNPNPIYTIQPEDINRSTQAPVELQGTVQPDGGLLITRPEADRNNPVDIPYVVTVRNNNGPTEIESGILTLPAGITQGTIPASELPRVSPQGGLVSYDMRPPAGYTIDDSRLNRQIPAQQPTTSPNPDTPVVGVGTSNGGGGTGGTNGPGSGGSGNGGNSGGAGSGGAQDRIWTNPSFTVDRRPGSNLNQPVVISYEVGGTAVPGVDYRSLPGTITIPAGQTSATAPIELLRPPSELNGRTIRIRLLDDIGYDLAQGRGSSDLTITPGNRPGNRPGNGNGNGNGEVVTGAISETDSDGNSDDEGSGSGGSGLGTAAAFGGLGVVGAGVAAASGAFGGPNLFANACPANFQLPDQVEQLARQVDSDGEINWERITFETLPSIDRRPAVQVLTLGQFGDALGKMSLKDVARVTGEDLGSLTLSALLGISPTATVGDIPGLAEQISQAGAGNKQARPVAANTQITASTQLSALLSQQPAMRNLTLGEIPGVMDMELQSIANWQQIPVGQIPGLAQAPFDELFPCLNEPQPRRGAEGNYEGRSSRSGQGGAGTGSAQ